MKTPKLKIEPEYEPSFTAWQMDPTPDTGAQFLTTIKPVIDDAVGLFGGQAAGPALKAQAKVIAMDAAKKYKPETGKLRPFLMSHLQGLRRVAATETQPIKIPERLRLDNRTVQAATTELQDELGREPADSEVADRTGLSLKRLGNIRKLMFATTSSKYENAASNVVGEEGDKGWESFVYHTLPPQDQLVMEYSQGWNNRPILGTSEIAKKLNVSAAAVSQRKARIQALIDQRSEK